VFDPPIHLNPLPWFPAFLKSQSNFSLGLQSIKDEFVTHLEELWSARRAGHPAPATFPDEVEPGTVFREGAVVRVSVNAYERNPAARRACIEQYGTNCCICGFNFGQVYGSAVDGLIHVHHLRPLAKVGAEYTIDPIADLRPVCPNCHAVLHSRTPAYSIVEVQRLLQRRGGDG
jgi:predicted HNH restriction endonuclease